MGWERKRGKLEEFVRLLRGAADTSYTTQLGELQLLSDVRFVITLDRDTRLPREAARTLVGIAAHPLNRACYEESRRRVTDGYGILQPRVSVTFESAAGSLFARLYAGHTGVDPYTSAVSDTYQDLFAEGIFTGKGLLDVEAFARALEGRVPENALLSHDLFEGLFARTALVSDVELVDDYPASVLTHARRLHRWVRGDWQILYWLFPWMPVRGGVERNPLPLISRYKIFDNLRRSAVPPAYLLFLAAAWTLLPGSPLVWTLGALLALSTPALLGLIDALGGRRREPWRIFLGHFFESARAALGRAVIAVTFLAFQAAEMLHAIGLTLVRLLFTQRRLLEWETAAAAAARAAGQGKAALRAFTLEMAASPILAAVLLLAVMLVRPEALSVAAPFALLWLLAPAFAYLLSRPQPLPKAEPLPADRQRLLRSVARRSWRYFEDFVGPTDHWLPPDNFQEQPGPTLAHRTSPTNIGLSLLASLAAHDLGYLGTQELVERVEKTLATLDLLEHYEGHLLNWYDTRTLLPPATALRLDGRQRQPRGRADRAGPGTSGARARSRRRRGALRAGPGGRERPAVRGAQGLRGRAQGRPLARRAAATEPAPGEGRRRRAAPGGRRALMQNASAWLQRALLDWPSDSPEARDVAHWARAIVSSIETAATPADASLQPRLLALADKAQRRVAAMNFKFLYDARRKLFAIGYRLGDSEGPGRLDGSSYDLLASEACLASFLAIAKEDAPQEHWFQLGRPFTSVAGAPALLSWSATMFEYLMPRLLVYGYPGTLLERSQRLAVRRQIEYARERGVPWGISESAYAVVDRHGNYQYKAFGVPGLGLKRGLTEDLVVAPYASALAAIVDPGAAARNFERLAGLGMLGRHGFYEAIDYTPRKSEVAGVERGPDGFVIVRQYLAHHQGMSLVALANVLTDQAMVKRFHADARVQATELVLQERVPRGVVIQEPRQVEETRVAPPSLPMSSRRFRSPHTVQPHAHFLSNGSYTVIVTNAGGGASLWRGRAVTRLREDATRDACGSFVYLRDVRSGDVWSAAFQPTCREPEEYVANFLLEKVSFRRVDHEIESVLELAVSPEDDVEVRRLVLSNRSERQREIEVTSYAEPVLLPPADDLAHPVFAKLFVETAYEPQSRALLCWRRPRRIEDAPLFGVHALAVSGALTSAIEWETDRARFLGRGGDPSDPQALRGGPLSGTTGAVLDPVLSLRYRIRLAPGASARICFSTGVAADRAAAQALAQKYHDMGGAARAFALAHTHAHMTLRHLGISSEEAQLFERLASRVLYVDGSLRAAPELRARNTLGQSGLWAHGVSGDLPILLVRVVEEDDLPLVRQVLQAQEYWRLKGLSADVVILNEHPASYLDAMHEALSGLLQSGPWAAYRDKPGGAFLLRGEAIPSPERVLLQAVARAVLSGERGELAQQLDRPVPEPRFSDDLPRHETPAAPAPPRARPALRFDNGFGGFSEDGREYVVVLDGADQTPQPWTNVLANPRFGTLLSESGAATTWAENSRENRLTPFAHDPVSDPSAEAILVRDDESGRVRGATPGAQRRRAGGGRYMARFSAGRARFEHESDGLWHELEVCVAARDPVKLQTLTLENRSPRPRRLSVFAYQEWALGPPRAGEHLHVQTELDAARRAVFARNPFNLEFPGVGLRRGQRAAALGDRRPHRVPRPQRLAAPRRRAAPPRAARPLRRRTGSVRRAALPRRPAAGRTKAAGVRAGPGPGPQPRQSAGRALRDGRRGALRLGRSHAPVGRDPAHGRGEDARRLLRRGHERLAAVPGAGVPHLGALRLLPARRRVRIPRPAPGRDGVRAGAPRAGPRSAAAFRGAAVPRGRRAALVARAGGQGHAHALLRRHAVAALRGGALHRHHRRPRRARRAGRLPGGAAAHRDAARRLQPAHARRRAGAAVRALPARDRPRPDRRAARPAADRRRRLERRHEPGGRAGPWRERVARLVPDHACCAASRRSWTSAATPRAPRATARRPSGCPTCWSWPGTALVSARLLRRRHAARLEAERAVPHRLAAQSWAVLSARPRRARGARDGRGAHAPGHRQAGLILLLTPAFDNPRPDPGYIAGYPPGIRENGGQYTHAALWTVMALARLGSGDEAVELFHMLNPINHARTPRRRRALQGRAVRRRRGRLRPPEHLGRGGWTWYTGSAGWMYRTGLEEILGLRARGDHCEIDPCIPAAWAGLRAALALRPLAVRDRGAEPRAPQPRRRPRREGRNEGRCAAHPAGRRRRHAPRPRRAGEPRRRLAARLRGRDRRRALDRDAGAVPEPAGAHHDVGGRHVDGVGAVRELERLLHAGGERDVAQQASRQRDVETLRQELREPGLHVRLLDGLLTQAVAVLDQRVEGAPCLLAGLEPDADLFLREAGTQQQRAVLGHQLETTGHRVHLGLHTPVQHARDLEVAADEVGDALAVPAEPELHAAVSVRHGHRETEVQALIFEVDLELARPQRGAHVQDARLQHVTADGPLGEQHARLHVVGLGLHVHVAQRQTHVGQVARHDLPRRVAYDRRRHGDDQAVARRRGEGLVGRRAGQLLELLLQLCELRAQRADFGGLGRGARAARVPRVERRAEQREPRRGRRQRAPPQCRSACAAVIHGPATTSRMTHRRPDTASTFDTVSCMCRLPDAARTGPSSSPFNGMSSCSRIGITTVGPSSAKLSTRAWPRALASALTARFSAPIAAARCTSSV
jgi:cellobiose phosphorylase